MEQELNIPDNVIASLARAAAPAILAYFESEAGRAAYEAWQQARAQSVQDNCA